MREGDPEVSVFDRVNMVEPLLQAYPLFYQRWQALHDEGRGDEEFPIYFALSELARHLIGDLESGNTQHFDAVFDVVELWHVQGNADVKEAATVGLLEDLQNCDLHQRTKPEDFLEWLRPETRVWWGKVEAFWAKGTPII